MESGSSYILADKGYDSDTIRASLREAGIRACIPPKSNRKTKIHWSRRIYRGRNCIERTIGHLKINRAIATHYDKLAHSFLDTLHVAAIRHCLHLGNYRRLV